TLSKAKPIAEQYGFKYATLSEDNLDLLKKYNDLIVQTTSLGMNSREPSNEKNDPIFFYDFTGKEMLFDLVYVPSVTPIMARASKAGCRFCNGYEMLRYQGYEQFKLFTDKDY
ncbi:MAG: 3-dehydroquinate dehydratase, partial [Treponema sp.]|nr:3-dehydroquinate dehydratase [Treponema sp.]